MSDDNQSFPPDADMASPGHTQGNNYEPFDAEALSNPNNFKNDLNGKSVVNQFQKAFNDHYLLRCENG